MQLADTYVIQHKLCKIGWQTSERFSGLPKHPLRLWSGLIREDSVVEFGVAIKNPAYRILQTDISG